MTRIQGSSFLGQFIEKLRLKGNGERKVGFVALHLISQLSLVPGFYSLWIYSIFPGFSILILNIRAPHNLGAHQVNLVSQF